MMKAVDVLVALSILASPFASSFTHAAGQPAEAAATPAPLAEGEIRKVDKSAGKLTIKHGPLENLGMGPMTMVFRVQDPGLLDRVKAGDRVRFRAERIGGVLTVTQLEPGS